MANNDASVLEKPRQMVVIKQANADTVEQLEQQNTEYEQEQAKLIGEINAQRATIGEL